jgi:hypothetical protein
VKLASALLQVLLLQWQVDVPGAAEPVEPVVVVVDLHWVKEVLAYQ